MSLTERSRRGEPSGPRKYFWATMLVAFCDQTFGNSTLRCSKAIRSPEPIRASRCSHSTSAKGSTPGRVNDRSTRSPDPWGVCTPSPVLMTHSLPPSGGLPPGRGRSLRYQDLVWEGGRTLNIVPEAERRLCNYSERTLSRAHRRLGQSQLLTGEDRPVFEVIDPIEIVDVLAGVLTGGVALCQAPQRLAGRHDVDRWGDRMRRRRPQRQPRHADQEPSRHRYDSKPPWGTLVRGHEGHCRAGWSRSQAIREQMF